MTTLQAIIPDDIHEAVNSQRSTLNSQPAQRAAVALPLPRLTVEERAARGNWEAFDRIMSRVPDAPPVPGDERMETAQAMKSQRSTFIRQPASNRPGFPAKAPRGGVGDVGEWEGEAGSEVAAQLNKYYST